LAKSPGKYAHGVKKVPFKYRPGWVRERIGRGNKMLVINMAKSVRGDGTRGGGANSWARGSQTKEVKKASTKPPTQGRGVKHWFVGTPSKQVGHRVGSNEK